jgi:hypothetical protein
MIFVLNKVSLLLFGLTILAPAGALGTTRDALPQTLRAQDFRSTGVLEFPGDPRAHLAPLGVRITLDGSPLNTRSALDTMFSEKFYVHLAGGPIVVNPSGHAQGPTWQYPVGTRVFHEIRFRTSGDLFELRFLERLQEGWHFGTYLPRDTETWVQTQYNGRPKVEFKLPHPQTGRPAVLQLERIPLAACQNCHFNSSPSRYQYRGPADTGPCAFGPAHPDLIDWAKQAQARTGQAVINVR